MGIYFLFFIFFGKQLCGLSGRSAHGLSLTLNFCLFILKHKRQLGESLLCFLMRKNSSN